MTMRVTGLFVTLLAAAALVAAPAAAETLVVQVQGVRSSTGQIVVGVHDPSGGFPSRWSRALRVARVPAGRGPIVVTFENMPVGRYAVIAVHDEDADGEMTKNLVGIPKEGYGTSNNPTFLGPPRFGPAAFRLEGTVRLTIKVGYL